jgi:hypothetical protein
MTTGPKPHSFEEVYFKNLLNNPVKLVLTQQLSTAINREKDAGGVMLAMCGAYNDVVSALAFGTQFDLLNERRPNQSENCSAVAGHLGGLKVFVLKNLFLSIHKINEHFRENGSTILSSTLMRNSLRKMRKGERAFIEYLASNSSEDFDTEKLEEKFQVALHDIKTIEKLRHINNAHIDRYKLLHRVANDCLERNDEQLFLSDGDSLETTRYYFADRFSELLIQSLDEGGDISLRAIRSAAKVYGETLRKLIWCWLTECGVTPTPIRI